MLRALGLFWASVLLVLAAIVATLQILGPPAPMPQPVTALQPAPPPLPAALPADTAAPPPPGAAIAAPDPGLLEPAKDYPGSLLPRIGTDGRAPMRVYAAGYDPADTHPRIALLVADIGMSGQDGEDALRQLPAAVSLAFSPYAARPEALLAAARAGGHESLIALPLEPQGAPLNDAGTYSLLTGAPAAVNALRLEWALSRISGYVGATVALGRLHGERFAGAADQMGPVLEELAGRGLIYIDPRPTASGPAGSTAPAAGRVVDMVIDEPPLRTQIDSKLSLLEQIARDRGSAMGLADDPAPVTVERIAAWAAGLSQRGFTLVPVSALTRPAAAKPATAQPATASVTR